MPAVSKQEAGGGGERQGEGRYARPALGLVIWKKGCWLRPVSSTELPSSCLLVFRVLGIRHPEGMGPTGASAASGQEEAGHTGRPGGHCPGQKGITAGEEGRGWESASRPASHKFPLTTCYTEGSNPQCCTHSWAAQQASLVPLLLRKSHGGPAEWECTAEPRAWACAGAQALGWSCRRSWGGARALPAGLADQACKHILACQAWCPPPTTPTQSSGKLYCRPWVPLHRARGDAVKKLKHIEGRAVLMPSRGSGAPL